MTTLIISALALIIGMMVAFALFVRYEDRNIKSKIDEARTKVIEDTENKTAEARISIIEKLIEIVGVYKVTNTDIFNYMNDTRSLLSDKIDTMGKTINEALVTYHDVLGFQKEQMEKDMADYEQRKAEHDKNLAKAKEEFFAIMERIDNGETKSAIAKSIREAKSVGRMKAASPTTAELDTFIRNCLTAGWGEEYEARNGTTEENSATETAEANDAETAEVDINSLFNTMSQGLDNYDWIPTTAELPHTGSLVIFARNSRHVGIMRAEELISNLYAYDMWRPASTEESEFFISRYGKANAIFGPDLQNKVEPEHITD